MTASLKLVGACAAKRGVCLEGGAAKMGVCHSTLSTESLLSRLSQTPSYPQNMHASLLNFTLFYVGVASDFVAFGPYLSSAVQGQMSRHLRL